MPQKNPTVADKLAAKEQYTRVSQLADSIAEEWKLTGAAVKSALEMSDAAWRDIESDLDGVNPNLSEAELSSTFTAAFDEANLDMLEIGVFETTLRIPYLVALHRACV
jgi:hypothetical protein